MENILKKIILRKKEKLESYKKNYPINNILNDIKNITNLINFKDKIKNRTDKKEISIIAEIKKASPSAGLLLKDFNPLDLAKIYLENGASFLSVLTEEDFFMGHLNFIKLIKDKYKIPILCKDFFIDTYQVPLAKSFGADCILIILSAIDKKLAYDIYQTANDLNISSIIEVHTEKEAEESLIYENSMIGINNRNLKTLDVTLDTCIKLSKILISHKNPLICESGIKTVNDIKLVIDKTNVSNFLIGESLLTSNDIGGKLREFAQISL